MNRQILKYIVLGGLFIIPFIPFFVSSSLFFPFITTKGFAFRIIIEIVFASWVLLAIAEPAYRPKKTWTTYALLIFIAIIGVADLFGASPVKSFWSNAERMEGFISLLHFGMFFLVIRNFFNELDWKRFWNTSLATSFLMAVYCIFQLAGSFEIHQGGARVDGTLGNAAYLAVYMLVHVFIALFYMARTERMGQKYMYGALALLNAFILYESATRGAILGLLGGLLVTAVIGLMQKESVVMKKMSLAYVGLFVLIIVGFFAFRTSGFVQQSETLSRFASISPTELKGEGRSFVWPMALQGIKERPFLGWGQDNFNYVFNKHYSPQMFRLEPWFDRAHNIFLDWAIAGGILGLLAYLSLYYVLLVGLWKNTRFNITDKAAIAGLVSAYFFHNIFVFDHLISYILFISLLAFVDAQTPDSGVVFGSGEYNRTNVQYVGTSVTIIALLFGIYHLNILPLKANATLISGLQNMQTGNMSKAVSGLEMAYETARLGKPEIVEQISSNSTQILSSSLSMEEKNSFYSFARQVVEKQAEEQSQDARYQLLAGSFLSSTGKFDEALTYLEKARELTPGKPLVYFEIATIYINKGEYAKGLETLRTVYDLDHNNLDAEKAYLIGAIFAEDVTLEKKLSADIVSRDPHLLNDERITNAYITTGRYDDVAVIFESKITANPSDPQGYINLAALYLKAGNKIKAITALQRLSSMLPSYKTTADGYIEQIKNGSLK